MTTPQDRIAQAEAAAAYLRDSMAKLAGELAVWQGRVAQERAAIGAVTPSSPVEASEAQKPKRAYIRRRHRTASVQPGPSQRVIATLLQEAKHTLTVAELTSMANSRQLITSKNGPEGVRTVIGSAILRMTKNGSVFWDKETHRYGLAAWSKSGAAQPLALVAPP